MSVREFKIGDIECAVLQEGAAQMDRDTVIARYPNADRAAIEAALDESAPSGSLNLLYFSSGGLRVLADVGFGASGPPGMDGARRGLASLGISPADIDIIYLTHFHGDHIAGLCDAAGAPVYANAGILTTAAEWDEWLARWQVADDAFPPQFRGLEGRFSFVEDGERIAPGVRVVALPGHTLGHSGLLLESGGERLLHAVDLLHQPFQFKHTDWHFGFDSDGGLAVETRQGALGRCADEGLLTLFYHLEFPGLGRVLRVGGGFAWQPKD